MSSFRNFATLLVAGSLAAACSPPKKSTTQSNAPSPAPTNVAQVAIPSDFTTSKRQVFNVSGPGQLKIDCACDVTLVQGSSDKVGIAIDADSKDVSNFEVGQKDRAIFVREKNQFGGPNITSSNSSIVVRGGVVGGNFTVNGNGGVIVNGLDVTDKVKPTKTPHLTITIPENEDLDAKFEGMSTLTSSVAFNQAYIGIEGGGKIEVTAKTANVSVSGSGNAQLHITGGDLDLDVSGSGDLRASGAFTNIHASISGSGDVQTEGPVSGDYMATSSGSGYLSHTGPIRGHVHKNVSGSGSIDITP